MKKFFQNLGYKFQRFMLGRYGMDNLWRVLLISYLVLIIIANIVYRFSLAGYYIIFTIATALIVFALYRAFSKNIDARRKENQKWLSFASKIKRKNTFEKNKWEQRKIHKFVKCTKCKKVLRLPRHKGKINVTCPHCANKFIVNTGKKISQQ